MTVSANTKNADPEVTGRKIFFLLPSAMVQNGIVAELVQNEYEVYVTGRKDTLRRVLRQHPDSIVFVDINEKMAEAEREIWVRAVQDAPDTKTVSIGILSSNDSEALRAKYLGALKVACGFTVLRFDAERNTRQILEILHAAGAKGRRKFVRANLDGETNASINIPLGGKFVRGSIRDISSTGISFTLEGNPEIAQNAFLRDAQIILQTNRLKVEGVHVGLREEGTEKIYVLIFSNRIDSEVRARIRAFIHHHLQLRMDAELKK